MPEKIPQSVTIRVPLQAYLTGTTTPATGKTIAIMISKNGASYANPSGGATDATEVGSGSYYVDLSTTDTGTLGPLWIKGTNADIDNVIAIYNVVNAHNAGFDGIPSATGGASGGLPLIGTGANNFKSDSSANVTATSVIGAVGSVTGNVGGNVVGSVGSTPTASAQLVKVLAAVYDSATSDGVDTLTLSNGATQQINLTTGARTTT